MKHSLDVMATVEQFMGQKGSDHIPNRDTFDNCLCSPREAGCRANGIQYIISIPYTDVMQLTVSFM